MFDFVMGLVIIMLCFMLYNSQKNKTQLTATLMKLNQAWSEERQERADSYDKVRLLELSDFLGKLVICVSNEKQNPTVGVARRVELITKAQNPVLIVYDLVAREEIMVLGKVFAYNEQKFKALNEMDANARIALLYAPSQYEELDKTYCQTDTVLPPDVWGGKVRDAISYWEKINNEGESRLA